MSNPPPVETLEVIRDRFISRLEVHVKRLCPQTRGDFDRCIKEASIDIAAEFTPRAAQFCLLFADAVIRKVDAK